MDIHQGAIKLIIGITERIGSLLFLFGFISFEKNSQYIMVLLGALLLIISQTGEIASILCEPRKKLETIYDEFLNKIGLILAWPLVIFIVYLINQSQPLLLFTLAITIIAAIKATSLVIKVYLIDNILHTTWFFRGKKYGWRKKIKFRRRKNILSTR